MDPMHPGDRAYRNTSIRLPELAVVTDVLTKLTFENCAIHGPAVVFFGGSTSLSNCSFGGPEEGLYWDTGDRDFIIGAIALIDCTFVGCRFQGIGIAVAPRQREIFKKGIRFTQ